MGLTLLKSPERPSGAQSLTRGTPPPPYRLQDMPWVARERGGGGVDRCSTDQQDWSHWVGLAAEGRLLGAATQVTQTDRLSLPTHTEQHASGSQRQRDAAQLEHPSEAGGTLHQVLTMVGDLRL